MQHKTLVACAAVAILAIGAACSKNSDTPVSPSATEPGSTAVLPDGSTLKATAPTPISPINNEQPDQLLLVAGRATAKFTASPTFLYEFEIRNSDGNATIAECSSGAIESDGGDTVSFAPICTLEFDQPYTWRARAALRNAAGQLAYGPWSSNATFKAPAGGYIRDSEVFDPLVNGTTVGDIFGPTEFIPGQGLKLLDFSSHVTYRLPVNLQQGEYSMMILGADEGSPGDKSKVFSMQEGPDEGDIVNDDYRMTAELRGRQYGAPGSVTFRIIAGDGHSRDGQRRQLNFSSSRWYFWRFTWQTGFARLEVKEDGPNGQTIYDAGVGTGSHPYRPDPHYLHLGSPIDAHRGCRCDATMPGIIIKNVWASSRPRPAFPGE